MIILDTHAVVWFADNPKLLSVRARRAIESNQSEGAIGIAEISFWEIAMLVEKGRLSLALPVRVWLEKLASVPVIRPIGVTPAVAAMSAELARVLPGDPADRIIAAVAVEFGASLVTKDARLRKCPRLKCVW